MSYVTKTTHDSKLPAFAGVKFVFHAMTERRRIERELAVADMRVRLQEAGKAAEPYRLEYWKFLKPVMDAKTDEERVQLSEALEASGTHLPFEKAKLAYDRIQWMEWKPAWIRWAVVSIDGFVVDEKPAGVEELLRSDGPEDLVDEIFDAILEECGLGTAKSFGSPPPGTSAEPADGKTNNSTATNVKLPTGTAAATAVSTSPAT